MDLSGVYEMFAVILAASVFFLYVGIVGIKRNKEEDELHKVQSEES